MIKEKIYKVYCGEERGVMELRTFDGLLVSFDFKYENHENHQKWLVWCYHPK